MKTIHIKVLRKPAKSSKWEVLEHNGDAIHEVPVTAAESPATTDCTEFVLDTLSEFRLYPGDSLKVEKVRTKDLRDYTPAVHYIKTIAVYGKMGLWIGRDTIRRHYVGLPITVNGTNGHLVLEVDAAEIKAFVDGRSTHGQLVKAGRNRQMYTAMTEPSRPKESVILDRFDGEARFPNETDQFLVPATGPDSHIPK